MGWTSSFFYTVVLHYNALLHFSFPFSHRREQEVLVRDNEGHARRGPGRGGHPAAVSARREDRAQRHLHPLCAALPGGPHW